MRLDTLIEILKACQETGARVLVLFPSRNKAQEFVMMACSLFGSSAVHLHLESRLTVPNGTPVKAEIIASWLKYERNANRLMGESDGYIFVDEAVRLTPEQSDYFRARNQHYSAKPKKS